MTPVASTPTSSRPTSAAAVQATGWAMAVVKAFRAWRNRRTIFGLAQFDERMLADIGLTRGDVVASLSGPALSDPSDRLSALAGERRQAIRAMARERLEEAAQARAFRTAAE